VPEGAPVATAPAFADGERPETDAPETDAPETAPPDHPAAALPTDPGQGAAELDLGPPAPSTTVPAPSR
jgi:hypothetical protein